MTEPSGIKTSDLFQGQNISSNEATLAIIASLHGKLYEVSLDETEKLKVVGILMNELLISTGNSPAKLFDLVPDKYLFQLLIDLHVLGVDIEPMLNGIDLNRHEQGLSVLLTLGDFADDKYVNSLIFFYSKLETQRCQNALLKIAENCVEANNHKKAKKMLHEIYLRDDRFFVIEAIFAAHLLKKEFDEAENITFQYKSYPKSAFLYSELAEAYLKNDLYDKAFEMLGHQDQPLIRFEVLVQIILYHIRTKNTLVVDVMIDEAVELVGDMDDLFIQSMCATELAEIEMIFGRPDELKMRVEDVLYRIDKVLDFEQGCLVFNYLFSSTIFYEYTAQAYDLLCEKWGGVGCNGGWMMDQNHTTDVSCAIFTILKQIKKLVRENEITNSSTNNSEIKRLCKVASDTVYFLDDTKVADELCNKITLSFAENGLFGLATKMTLEWNCKNYIYSYMPLLALKRKRYKKALKLTEAIYVSKNKIETQLIMSPHLAKNGYKTEANQFVQNWVVSLSHKPSN
ncbi:MAG: hypothetical protein WCI92_00470 [Bacteroidota bacterium]